VIALVREDGRKRFADASFVVNHENVRMRRHEKSVEYKVQQQVEVLQRRDSAHPSEQGLSERVYPGWFLQRVAQPIGKSGMSCPVVQKE